MNTGSLLVNIVVTADIVCYCLSLGVTTECCAVGPRSVNLSSEDYHVHEVATVLKRFLRTLDDPLLTQALYNQWITASRNHSRLPCYIYYQSCTVEVCSQRWRP